MTMMGQTCGFPVPRGRGRRARAGAGPSVHLPGWRDPLRQRGDPRSRSPRPGGRCRARRRRAVRRTPQRGRRRLRAAPLRSPGRPERQLPAPGHSGMKRFRMDPGTVKVDWALSGPVPWAAPPAHAPGTVHVADSIEAMTESLGQVGDGVDPRAAVHAGGADDHHRPHRSPAGTESMWAYTHVPQHTTRDAGDGGIRGSGTTTTASASPTGCRRARDARARLRAAAPARRVLGPRELEARNANLIGGAVGGGTVQLRQQLVFRRSRASAGPRPGSAGSTSAPPPPTPAAASTARAVPTPPGRPCSTTASPASSPGGTRDPRPH